jgi:carbon monoxide dehydrogenase subunit G
MSEPMESRTISVRVDRPIDEAYAFLSQPENFPKWASGLCTSVEQVGGEWIAQTPTGPMKVRFAPPNGFGVLDHAVIPDDGVEIHVPMRILPSGSGSEVALTLYRQPGMTDEQFDEDAAWVKKDLETMKRVLQDAKV